MQVSCSPIFAEFDLGFCLCTNAIAAADESYTNLIAPHQRVQPVSGPVCLYLLLLMHSRHFRIHLLAGACLPCLLTSLIPCGSCNLCCIECVFRCLRAPAAADSISNNSIPSHSRSQLVSGPHRKDLGCAPDEIDGFLFAISAWPPACVPAYFMRGSRSPMYAARSIWILAFATSLSLLLLNPTRI